MTKEKLNSLFAGYRTVLVLLWSVAESPQHEARQLSESQAREYARSILPADQVAHCKFMCDEAARLVDAGEVEKAMRQLGFLQGVLWDSDMYTLDELKNHSRADGAGVAVGSPGRKLTP